MEGSRCGHHKTIRRSATDASCWEELCASRMAGREAEPVGEPPSASPVWPQPDDWARRFEEWQRERLLEQVEDLVNSFDAFQKAALEFPAYELVNFGEESTLRDMVERLQLEAWQGKGKASKFGDGKASNGKGKSKASNGKGKAFTCENL